MVSVKYILFKNHIIIINFYYYSSLEARKTLSWALKCLEEDTFPRQDYKELLELTILYLSGDIPTRKNRKEFHFRKPGAHHRARFMHNELYLLKMHMLSE